MIGATIGAGVGPYQGLHGLVIDALLSVRLVTASGKIVMASEQEHEGLFWAVRGAGANFGIITSATYKVDLFRVSSSSSRTGVLLQRRVSCFSSCPSMERLILRSLAGV